MIVSGLVDVVCGLQARRRQRLLDRSISTTTILWKIHCAHSLNRAVSTYEASNRDIHKVLDDVLFAYIGPMYRRASWMIVLSLTVTLREVAIDTKLDWMVGGFVISAVALFRLLRMPAHPEHDREMGLKKLGAVTTSMRQCAVAIMFQAIAAIGMGFFHMTHRRMLSVFQWIGVPATLAQARLLLRLRKSLYYTIADTLKSRDPDRQTQLKQDNDKDRVMFYHDLRQTFLLDATVKVLVFFIAPFI